MAECRFRIELGAGTPGVGTKAGPGAQGAGSPLLHLAPAKAAPGCAVGSDLPFSLGRQATAGPARPGLRLPPAHMHGALLAGRAQGGAEAALQHRAAAAVVRRADLLHM